MKQWFKDKILLARLKTKDTDAFAEIYDLYVTKIYRFIYFKVSSVEEAEDLTSEVFLKSWQYISEGKKIENMNALLYRIARNAVIDFYRSRAKTEALEENISGDQAVSEDDLKNIEISLDFADMEKSLRDLKDEYREVIVLRFVDELSIKEIADILEKNKGTVRVLIFRALQALKQLLLEEQASLKK